MSDPVDQVRVLALQLQPAAWLGEDPPASIDWRQRVAAAAAAAEVGPREAFMQRMQRQVDGEFAALWEYAGRPQKRDNRGRFV